MINWIFFNVHTINLVYSVAGLAVLLATLILLFDYLSNGQKLYLRVVAPYVWWVILLTSIGGVATTLLYSEVLGFIPCSLCWLQRVALYPQVLMGLVAFKFRESVYFPIYGITLSAFGLVVAIYQYIYQMLPREILESGLVPCLADGSADCSLKVMEVFGFVTFPFLSAILFGFLIVIYLHLLRSSK
jgi:disulfide bond formation protein DsbB